MSNSLDPDQAQHVIGPDLGPDCLQKLSVAKLNMEITFEYSIFPLMGIAFEYQIFLYILIARKLENF